MKSIKREMILDLPDALMECCELVTHSKLPNSSAAELMKQAKDMSELLGDCFVYNYAKKGKTIEMIERYRSLMPYVLLVILSILCLGLYLMLCLYLMFS